MERINVNATVVRLRVKPNGTIRATKDWAYADPALPNTVWARWRIVTNRWPNQVLRNDPGYDDFTFDQMDYRNAPGSSWIQASTTVPQLWDDDFGFQPPDQRVYFWPELRKRHVSDVYC